MVRYMLTRLESKWKGEMLMGVTRMGEKQSFHACQKAAEPFYLL